METKSRFLIERSAFTQMQVESSEKYLEFFAREHGEPKFFLFQSVNHFGYAVLTVDIEIEQMSGQIQFLIDPQGNFEKKSFKLIDEILFQPISSDNIKLIKYLN